MTDADQQTQRTHIFAWRIDRLPIPESMIDALVAHLSLIPLVQDFEPTVELADYHGRRAAVVTLLPSASRHSNSLEHARLCAHDFAAGAEAALRLLEVGRLEAEIARLSTERHRKFNRFVTRMRREYDAATAMARGHATVGMDDGRTYELRHGDSVYLDGRWLITLNDLDIYTHAAKFIYEREAELACARENAELDELARKLEALR